MASVVNVTEVLGSSAPAAQGKHRNRNRKLSTCLDNPIRM